MVRENSPIVRDYIARLKESLKEIALQDINHIIEIIYDAYLRGQQIFIMGNGGSAATASHFVRDLKIGVAVTGRPRIRAISLTDNIATITSLANDMEFNSVFAEQLNGQIQERDVVIAISASGNSANVVKAIKFANNAGATTIALTGFGGGKCRRISQHCLVLSRCDYGVVEDMHMSIAHIITYSI